MAIAGTREQAVNRGTQFPVQSKNTVTATADADQSHRELAHRFSAGIEVTLVWAARADTASVLALDRRSGELLELRRERHKALEAFYRPYGCAAWRRAPEQKGASCPTRSNHS